jgi:hypothetical protein
MKSDHVTDQVKVLLNGLNNKQLKELSTILQGFSLKYRASFKQHYLAPPLKAIFWKSY